MVEPRTPRSEPSFFERVWSRLRGFLATAAVLAVAGGVVATGVVLSGVLDLSVKHGLFVPQLREILPFVRSRSVSFHADGVPSAAEDLDDPAVLQRAAAHYQVTCVGCHGAPGRKPSAFSRSMLPEPPRLAVTELVRDRTPEELYWVIDRGIRHTGMPAWPAVERPTEVWSMVALLKHFPEMTPERYRTLALLDRPGPSRQMEQPTPSAEDEISVEGGDGEESAVLESCASCHGYDGLGTETGAFPNLTILDEDYILASLQAYQDGQRHSGIMATQVFDVDDEEMREVARYYGARPSRPTPATDAPAELVQRGEAIVDRGIEDERGINECVSCHELGARSEAPVDEEVLPYPHLAGQYAPYLRQQLLAWTRQLRGLATEEDPQVFAAHQLRPDEIEAVAAYYASRTGNAER